MIFELLYKLGLKFISPFILSFRHDDEKFVFVIQVYSRPQTLLSGMNKFLESLEITFRRDPTNFRPRVNKMDSLKVTTIELLLLPGSTHKSWVTLPARAQYIIYHVMSPLLRVKKLVNR